MKRNYVLLLLLVIFSSSSYSQELLEKNVVCSTGGARANTTITPWNKFNLYYYIENYPSNSSSPTSTQCQTAIQNAFNNWSQYTNFTFTQTYNSYLADILLKWESGGNACAEYDIHDYAHSSLGMGSTPGFIHFNDEFIFTMTSSGYNLEAIALHYIGHVLGLIDDQNHSNSVMYFSYNYITDLTGYDLNAFYNGLYTFPWSITGHKLINQSQVYTIYNLPSVYNDVTWGLNNSFYNSYCMMLNPSHPERCLIYRNQNQNMMNGTLTATIKKGGVEVIQRQLSGIYAYDDFWGQYSSGNLSGNINYTHIFNVKTNTNTSVFSPNFYGATVSYSSSGATPTSWNPDLTNGWLYFTTSTPSVPVVINVTDGCGNSYTLYAYGMSQYKLNVSSGEGGITVSLVEDGDSDRNISVDQPWTVEVRNVTTGQMMATRSSTSRSETISTVGWPKGIYVVKATIGDEELTEKVIVK